MNKQNICLAIVIATVLIFGAVPMTTSVQAEDDGEFVDDSGEDGSGDSGGESTDDGYVYPDDSTPEEQQDIDEQEQEAYEDAGSPGEEQITCPDGTVVNSGDYCPDVIICPDGSTIAVGSTCSADVPTALVPEQTFTCSVDGSTVTGDEECPDADKPLPYCDTPAGKAASGCHDRFDTDSETGIATCNDGTHKDDPNDCKDATQKDLPRCAYGVVQDCTLNDLGQTCKIGSTEDACQDIFYGWDVNGDGKIDNKDKDGCEQPQVAVCNDGKPSTNVAPTPTPTQTIPPQIPAPEPDYINCPDGINDGIYTSYVLVGQICPSIADMEPIDCYLPSHDPDISKIQDSLCE